MRGDEVEKRYQTHLANLQSFHDRFAARLDSVAPELKPKLIPPADVPFGYQILPRLLADVTEARQTRIRLSPFSWPRTDSVITREADSLRLLERHFNNASTLALDEMKREYLRDAFRYLRLVAAQKFIASLIQYNRLWQNEIARLPESYTNFRRLQNVAMEQQRIADSLPTDKRLDSLTHILDSALRKDPALSYVRMTHPTEHQWIITVPVYTDITDSAFVEDLRRSIEYGWHVADNGDDFAVKLDLKRISPSELYPNGDVPANGTHIEIEKHLVRFPRDAAIFTTGSNSTYVFGRAVMIGPHAIPRKTLVHEFGHLLGFKDDYFRSYEDSGPDGYRVLEVILPPDAFLATPEDGHATRKHFEALIGEMK